MDENTTESLNAAVDKIKKLKELLDRPAFATRLDEKTLVFRLLVKQAQGQEDYILTKLGADGQPLIDKLKRLSVSLSGKTPEFNTATLCSNSEEVEPHVGELGDAIQCVNLAVEAVSLAKAAGINLQSRRGEDREVKGPLIKKEAQEKGLHEGTATMLEMLISGIIKVGGGCGNVALYLNREGCLDAFNSIVYLFPPILSFGPGPALESRI